MTPAEVAALYAAANDRRLVAHVEGLLTLPALDGFSVAPDGYGTPTIWRDGGGEYDVPVAVLRRNQIPTRLFWDALVAMVGGAA